MKSALSHDITSMLQVSHKEEKVVADHLQDNHEGTALSISCVSVLMTDHVLKIDMGGNTETWQAKTTP